MKIIIFFALASLTGYIIGYPLGRFTAEQAAAAWNGWITGGENNDN